jgi:CHAD domain-containing protein
MEDFLRADELPAEGVRRIILERVAYIHDLMLNPIEGREKAVHNTRKSCKRIRAALRLLRRSLGETAYRQENMFYRDTSRLVAPVRDSAVLLETLEKLAVAEGLPDGLVTAVQGCLAARHAQVCQQLLEETDVMAQVAERVENGRFRLLTLPLHDSSFTTLTAGLGQVYRLGRRDMVAAYASGRPEQFHEWRKQVKYLWHHLETIQPIWPNMLNVMILEFNRLSDFLGDAHDLKQLQYVLQDEAGRFGADPAFTELISLLDQRRHELERAAQPVGQRLYCEKPAAFVGRLNAYYSVGSWELVDKHLTA